MKSTLNSGNRSKVALFQATEVTMTLIAWTTGIVLFLVIVAGGAF